MVGDFLKEQGIFNMKRSKVQEHLRNQIQDRSVPTLNDISGILKEQFGLRYRKLDGALVKYNDPAYDEKRLWTCRLLSQFLIDDVLLISIDESHLRSDTLKRYGWQFVGNMDSFSKAIYTGDKNEESKNEAPPQEWGEIESSASFQSRPRSSILSQDFGPVPEKRGRGRPRKASSVQSTSNGLVQSQLNLLDMVNKGKTTTPVVEKQQPFPAQPAQENESFLSRFRQLQFNTPARRGGSTSSKQRAHGQQNALRLTPVIEEMTNLKLTSTEKDLREDFSISPLKASTKKQDPEKHQHQGVSALQQLREAYRASLGPGGLLAEQVSKQKDTVKKTPFSLSLISAVAFGEVLSNQLIEGGVDASVFEHFIFKTLEYVRTQDRYKGKRVVLLMDNARIHKHQMIIDTALKMKVILIFNAEYSPQLNPVERYFGLLKQKLRSTVVTSKSEIERFLGKFVQELTREEMVGLWGITIRQWVKTIVTSQDIKAGPKDSKFLSVMSQGRQRSISSGSIH